MNVLVEYFYTIENIDEYFCSDGYPRSLVYSQIIKFINDIMHHKYRFYTVEKCQYIFKYPFFGPHSYELKFELEKVFGKYMLKTNLRLVFRNRFKNGSFFKFKDTLPF